MFALTAVALLMASVGAVMMAPTASAANPYGIPETAIVGQQYSVELLDYLPSTVSYQGNSIPTEEFGKGKAPYLVGISGPNWLSLSRGSEANPSIRIDGVPYTNRLDLPGTLQESVQVVLHLQGPQVLTVEYIINVQNDPSASIETLTIANVGSQYRINLLDYLPDEIPKRDGTTSRDKHDLISSSDFRAVYNSQTTIPGEPPHQDWLDEIYEDEYLDRALPRDESGVWVEGVPSDTGSYLVTVHLRTQGGQGSSILHNYYRWIVNVGPPIVYTVTFDSNGGSAVAPREVSIGSSYGTLPTPTKSGYTFDGWYDGANRVTSATVPTKDTTLKAQWTPNIIQYTAPTGNLAAGTYWTHQLSTTPGVAISVSGDGTSWIQVDSGRLSGTPPSAGVYEVSVLLTAPNHISQSQSFTLNVVPELVVTNSPAAGAIIYSAV